MSGTVINNRLRASRAISISAASGSGRCSSTSLQATLANWPVANGAGSAPRDEARNFALGIDGFRYADLYEPARLVELDARFRTELEARDARVRLRAQQQLAEKHAFGAKVLGVAGPAGDLCDDVGSDVVGTDELFRHATASVARM